VNEVNGEDNVFGRCVSVCRFVRVCAVDRWELNANSSKTDRATEPTDLKYDKSVPRDSPDMTSKIFPKGGLVRVT